MLASAEGLNSGAVQQDKKNHREKWQRQHPVVIVSLWILRKIRLSLKDKGEASQIAIRRRKLRSQTSWARFALRG